MAADSNNNNASSTTTTTTTTTNSNTHTIDTLELDPADGAPYIVELRDRLIDLLLPCQNIDDVEERMRRLYPNSELVDLAILEASKSRHESSKNHKHRHHSSSSSASFTGALHNITSLAVAKVSNLVRDGVVGSKSESEVSKFKMALIEFIINDVLNLAYDFVSRQKANFIVTRSDIRTAMHADKDLLDMFLSDDKSVMSIELHPLMAYINDINHGHHINAPFMDKHNPFVSLHSSQSASSNKPLTYKQKVRNMVDCENLFIRGLKLIIKVFRAQLYEIPHIKQTVDILFCNIDDLLELSTTLSAALEEALESVGQQDDEIPYVGSEILDLAQAEEFQAYFTFAYRRLSTDESWRKAYLSIVSDETTMTSIKTAGQSFDLAVKHLLPNYLLNTIAQFFVYFNNICELYKLSKEHNNREDELALKESISILIKPKRAIIELTKERIDSELEYLAMESLDPKQAESIRITLQRKLDAELQHERNLPLPFMPPREMYRFSEPDSKENIQLEDFHNHRTLSKRDTDKQLRNESDQIPVIRCATLIKLVERLTYHKYQPNIVDSFLVTYRSFISDPEELLDLLIERFKIPDPPLSIVYPNFNGCQDELPENERIAYKHHLKRFRQEYSKPVKMRVINVLKSWIKNHYYDFERYPQLLDKLHQFLNEVYNSDKVLRSLIVSIKKSIEQKRNSQKDETFEFMLSQDPPPILWWIAKPNEPEKFNILTLHPVEFARQLTLIESDLFRAIKPSEFINVRELGLKTRKDDYESSPNLSRMTRHFTLLSYWIRKCLVECEDFDKRCAIYNRAIEIMGALKDLNNFTGLLSIGSAIESAPITRLSHTSKALPSTTARVIEDYRKMMERHQRGLDEVLKKCNPPCIPYLGSYQTKLIHAKEGNKTFIDEVDTISPTLSTDEIQSSFSNSPATPISPRTPLPRSAPINLPQSATSTYQNQFFGGCSLPRSRKVTGCSEGAPVPPTPGPAKLINFAKQRIRAMLVAEIGNYQNPPYCLKVQPEIRSYIESIESEIAQFAATLLADHSAATSATTTTTARGGATSMSSPPAAQADNSQPQQQALSGQPSGASAGPAGAELSVTAITMQLDNYLFAQSERIEPKNCTRPPRSKSKLPDCWKSPGIKVYNQAAAR